MPTPSSILAANEPTSEALALKSPPRDFHSCHGLSVTCKHRKDELCGTPGTLISLTLIITLTGEGGFGVKVAVNAAPGSWWACSLRNSEITSEGTTCFHAYVYVCLHACMHGELCVYTYIYIYACMYVNIYIYTYKTGHCESALFRVLRTPRLPFPNTQLRTARTPEYTTRHSRSQDLQI